MELHSISHKKNNISSDFTQIYILLLKYVIVFYFLHIKQEY